LIDRREPVLHDLIDHHFERDEICLVARRCLFSVLCAVPNAQHIDSFVLHAVNGNER
jgi:hypothetical protein